MSGFGGTIYPQLDYPGQPSGPTIGPATPQPTTPDALNAARAALFLHAIQGGYAPSTDPRSLFNGPNQYRDPRLTLPGAQPAEGTSAQGVLHPSQPMGYDDYVKMADAVAGMAGFTPPHANKPMTGGERLQNAFALATLGAGPLAEEFRLSGLAGKAAKAVDEGGNFDVATGDAVKGDFTPDPLYTRTILPHENPRAVIKGFLKDPQVQQRLQQEGAHLGVRTNPDGLPEVHVATPTEAAPAAPSYRVEDEGPAEHLANAKSIVSMHQQLYGPDVHLDPADLQAVAARAKKAGIDLHVTPRSSASDIMAQLEGREPNALPRRATRAMPVRARSFQDALRLPPGAPEELGASPGFGYEGPQPEGGPQLPVRGLLPRQAAAPLALPPGVAPAADSRIVAQGLSREDAVAQMKTLGQQGVRAQMQPMKDGTFNIVRKGEPHPSPNLPAVVKPVTPPIGTQGEATEAGLQSPLYTSVTQNPKYQGLNLTPEEWNKRLAADPNIPKDELEATSLDPESNLKKAADRMLQEHKQTYGERFMESATGRHNALGAAEEAVRAHLGRMNVDLGDMENVHAIREFFQSMRSAFPDIPEGGAQRLPQIEINDLAQHFDPAWRKLMAKFGHIPTDENTWAGGDIPYRVANQYNEARAMHNQAIFDDRDLHNPPDFMAKARSKQSESMQYANARLQGALDSKGRLSSQALQDYLGSRSPVLNLQKDVLESPGATGEPDQLREPTDDEIRERADEMANDWQEERWNDLNDLYQQRDAKLEAGRKELEKIYGEAGAQRIHDSLMHDFFQDSNDLKEMRGSDVNDLEAADTDELDQRFDQIAKGQDPQQGLLFSGEEHDPHITRDDLHAAYINYYRALRHDSDALEHLKDYHDPWERGPDFRQAAEEQIRDDIAENQEYDEDSRSIDPGDTKYVKYQRVNEEAPYREILMRNPNLGETYASHWQEQPGVIAHARGELHNEGKNYLMIEAQSDLAQKARRRGNEEMLDQLKPFHDTERWAHLATAASMHQAAQEGAESFSWVTPANRHARASLSPESGTITYGHAVPKAVSRIFKYLGEPMETEGPEVNEAMQSHGMPTVRLTPAMRQKILKMGVPALSTLLMLQHQGDNSQ